MPKPITFKRLNLDSEGNFTLEGRTVHPTIISPPFLAYYEASLQPKSYIENPFEKLRTLPELRLDQLPMENYPNTSGRHFDGQDTYTGPSMRSYFERCNAFIMSPVVARELTHGKGSTLNRDPSVDRISVKDWVAISLYQIPDVQ